jgi:hypothetical protein
MADEARKLASELSAPSDRGQAWCGRPDLSSRVVSLFESFRIDVYSTLRKCARGRDILIGSAVASVVSILVLCGVILPLEQHSNLCPVAAYLMDLAMLSEARGVEWPVSGSPP